jgi:hypothetical protein
MRTQLWTMALAVLMGCGASHDGHEMDGGHDTTDGVIGCDGDARLNFTAAPTTLPVPGQQVSLVIESTEPARLARGPSRWVVRLQASANGPAEAATLVSVTPTMPDHGHGSPTQPTVMARADGGWDVDGLNLSMPGVWTVALKFEFAGGLQATVQATLCIAG